MKRKRISFISLALAITCLLVLSTPVLAYYPPPSSGANANVTLGEIDVSGDLVVGSSATVTGTVSITSESYTNGYGSYTDASSTAWYEILDPDGIVISEDGNSESDHDSFRPGNNPESSASQTFGWSYTFTPDTAGTYTVSQGGEAEASWYKNWHSNDEDSDSDTMTITFNVVAPPAPSAPYVNLPDFGPDGGGGLLVIIGNSQHTYSWEDNTNNVSSTVSVIGKLNMNTYRLDIPEGTEIGCNGHRVNSLKLFISKDNSIEFLWGRFVQFSNTCTISQLVDGEWVIIASFTKIVRGIPQ